MQAEMVAPVGRTATRRRILVVDDDEQSRIALQTILEEEGFRVELAEDGDEGLELVRAFRPDLVFLDLVLPRLNGFDTAAALKRDDATAGIPIVAVTATWLGSDEERLRSAGFEGALRKPFDTEALLDAVVRVIPF